MGQRLANTVYARKCGSPHRKAILSYLANRADDEGRGIFCSKGTIAEATETARSTVFKVIRELVSEGVLIEVGQRHSESGPVVVYNLDVAKIEAMQPASSPSHGPQAVRQPDDKGSAQRTVVRSTDYPRPSHGPQAVRQPDPEQPFEQPLNKQQLTREADSAAALSKSARETILEAIGVDPVSGITGPEGRMIGTAADMATAATWSEMGLTLDQQVAVIREVCARARRKSPGWQPRGFGYFTDAMGDVRKARQSKPTVSADSDRDRKRAFWRRVSGAAA